MLDGLGPGHIHLADRAYDSNARRQGHDCAKSLGERENHAAPDQHPGVQPPSCTATGPRRALLQQLKRFRAVATRYEKHAANYQGLVELACALIVYRLCLFLG